MGHSPWYGELQAVDTSLATEVLAKVEAYGTVMQFAADNDLKEKRQMAKILTMPQPKLSISLEWSLVQNHHLP